MDAFFVRRAVEMFKLIEPIDTFQIHCDYHGSDYLWRVRVVLVCSSRNRTEDIFFLCKDSKQVWPGIAGELYKRDVVNLEELQKLLVIG